MEEFIKAMIELDRSISEPIIKKLKNNEKLEIWEQEWLITSYRLIERYKRNDNNTREPKREYKKI